MNTKKDFTGIALSEVTCGVVVTLTQWLIVSLLTDKIDDIYFVQIIAATIAIIIAVVVATGVQRLTANSAVKTHKRRLKIFDLAKYEGLWIEYIYCVNNNECIDDNSATFAICSLEYDIEKEEYIYRGRLYSDKLDPYTSSFVSFKSRCLFYDNSDIIYVNDPVKISVNNEFKNVSACGVMTRQDDTHFTGKFNDLYYGGSESLFRMRKIDSAIINSFNSAVRKNKKRIQISDLENTKYALMFIEWFRNNRTKYI